MITTENKIVNFFQKLSDSAVVNWIIKKVQLSFNYCIDNAYWLFFLFMFLGFFTQPVLFGAGFFLYGFIGIIVLIIVLIVFLFTGTDPIKLSKLRRWIFFIIGSVYAVSMTTTYNYIAGPNEYIFNKKKIAADIVSWNPLFKNMYPDVESRPKSVEFNVVTYQGDFRITHSCTAYVDAATWEIFNLDEQKLILFLREDAKKRLIASLNECRLDQVSSMSKTLHYHNGKFVRAEFNTNQLN